MAVVSDVVHVVGLDLSLTGTAVALRRRGALSTEHIIDVPKLRGIERIIAIRDAVLSLCMFYDDDGMPAESVAVIEDYAFSRAASHAHELGELGGAVKVALRENGVPYVLVSPSALKRFATGKGNATKPDLRMARLKRTGVDERDDNANDAFWLRQMGLHAYDLPDAVPLPAAQLQVVGSLVWPELATVTT